MSAALLWSTQYIAAAIVGLAVSVRILHKEPRVMVNHILLLYSLLISCWSLSVFIHRTTPYLEISELFFRIGAISLFVAQGVYLSMAFAIRSPKKRYLLVALPASLTSIIYLGFGEFRFTYTSFGWSYSLAGDLLSVAARGLTNEAYNLAILLALYFLYRAATNPLLKRKLNILLYAYLIFQFIGFSVTNLLLVTGADIPPFGGILHILTFVAMGYALTLRPKVTLTYLQVSSLSGRYTRFLNNLLDTLPGGALGQKYLLFSQFVKETDIEPYVKYVEDQPVFTEDRPPTIVSIIEKTLDYLHEHKLISLLDPYLPVINAAYATLPAEEAHKLDDALLKRAEFLLAGDILYGVDGGRLMQKIEVDKSLHNVSDIEAALRIYKRILLAAFPDFKNVLGSELLNRLLLYDVLKDIEADAEGYISIAKCLEKHKQDPSIKIITIFNSFLSSILSQIADTAPRAASLLVRKINRVLELNWRKASKLGIISTLQTSLADLTSEPITLPFLNEPITEETLKASNLILGQPLEENAGKAILLEFTTQTTLKLILKRLTVEALAKGYDISVFTRRGSVVEEALTPLDVKYIYLTLTRRSELEEIKSYVSIKDPSEMLAALAELNLSNMTLIIFDNLTDLILTTGFDKAYTFLRHVVELAAETRATILLGLCVEAHSKHEVAALEALANLTVNLERPIKFSER
jgi:hypothetical protein